MAINYTITFFGHKYFTYRNHSSAEMRRQFQIYAVMVLGFYVSNIILEPIFVEYVGLQYIVAQAIISAILTVVSLILTPRIFRSDPPAAP